MPTQEQLQDVIRLQTEMAELGLDLGGVMSLVVERAMLLTGADGAAIELEEEGEMVYRAASGIAEDQLGLRLKTDGSLSGLSVRSGAPLLCTDSETDPRADRDACRRVGLRSMAVMPLKHKDTVIGVLKVMARQPEGFSSRQIRLLELLTGMLAATIYWATRYDAESLFHKATHDDMTGLPNRALFMDRLRNALSQNGRLEKPAAILMVDMDGLKAINDTLGHRAGDLALREMAHRLRAGARQSDTVARLGGDEFAVLLTPVEPGAGTETAVTRLTRQVEAPFTVDDMPVPLRASIGAARYPEDGRSLDALLHLADQRMYTVKQSRPNRHLSRPPASG